MTEPILTAADFVADIKDHAKRVPGNVDFLKKFFKTGEGQYGAGDEFIGVRVPPLRALCKKYRNLGLGELEKLLDSPIHEIRLGAVIIMAEQAKQAKQPADDKKALYDLYLRRSDRINNWDIVDSSCKEVVGSYLVDKPRDVLYKLAKSKDLWERRIAIVSTWWFIRLGDLNDTFKISEMLLGDKQDLIHKAVGWMLRETGKKDRRELLKFLDKNAAVMPRTALRYAIEHLDVATREKYMKMKMTA